MKPYVEFIESLHNSGFWLVKQCRSRHAANRHPRLVPAPAAELGLALPGRGLVAQRLAASEPGELEYILSSYIE